MKADRTPPVSPAVMFLAVWSVCLLSPLTVEAQSFELKAAFPDLPAYSEPSPPATKVFSVSGPGILVIRTWLSPHLEVNTTYNSGGIFFAGKSSDSPFPRYIATRRYQNGRPVGGEHPYPVYGIDMYIVEVVELDAATYANRIEVHPSVKWSLGGQMEYQNRWTVRITMEVHPTGTDPNQFLGEPAKSPSPAATADTIVSYPKIKEFSGDFKYTAREDGVVLVRNNDGVSATVRIGPAAHPVAPRFRHVLEKDPGLAKQLGEALTGEVPAFDGALSVQVFRGGTLIFEQVSGVIWISRHGPRKPAAPPPAAVAETSWIVNGHPVPWVFHAGGIVEAPGLWKGAWVQTVDGYEVTLGHQGATDRFLVKISADGKTLTAYKNGQVYRSGVRAK